jgi:hypothetical protein
MDCVSQIKLPLVGIPSWSWKKKLCLYAINHPNLHNINVSEDLCYETSRHFELLRMFDEKNNNYIVTEYYKYQKRNGKKDKSILDMIKRFYKLYKSVKSRGCLHAPIVTDDGCRLDGSHRLSILIHVRAKTVILNVISYEDIFSVKKSRKIREHVLGYRKKIYGFDNG